MRNLLRALCCTLLLTAPLTVADAGIVISVKPAVPKSWKTFADEKHGFAISYPGNWRVDPGYVYNGFDHDIHGVAFFVPEGQTRGTNLSPSWTGVTVEHVDAAKCDATKFLPDPQDLKTLNNAGHLWSTANMTDAGAGNFYDIAVFALPGTKPCLAVRYTIHSTNIGNYDPGTVKEFDRDGLIRTFAKIRHTLVLKPGR